MVLSAWPGNRTETRLAGHFLEVEAGNFYDETPMFIPAAEVRGLALRGRDLVRPHVEVQALEEASDCRLTSCGLNISGEHLLPVPQML
jgi:hypothetical protein